MQTLRPQTARTNASAVPQESQDRSPRSQSHRTGQGSPPHAQLRAPPCEFGNALPRLPQGRNEKSAVPNRFLIGAAMAFVIAFTAFHATMVFATNMPDGALKQAVSPLLIRYSGPFIYQGWALFAPRPYPDNIHVLVRGKKLDGGTTGWYDVTKYFMILMRSDRFTPTRSLFAALQHAAPRVINNEADQPARSIVTRTSAMVLKLYEPKNDLAQMQIELDAWAGVDMKHPQAPSRVMNVTTLPWMAVPDVATF